MYVGVLLTDLFCPEWSGFLVFDSAQKVFGTQLRVIKLCSSASSPYLLFWLGYPPPKFLQWPKLQAQPQSKGRHACISVHPFETVWTFSQKLNVLTCCTGNRRCDSNGDLRRDSNHKSRDLKVRFELPETAICGKILAIWAPRFQITSDLRFVIWST